MRYERLDQQMKVFAASLTTEVGLKPDETGKLATTIAAEVRFLDRASRTSVIEASPVPTRCRLDELSAFQTWMDLASGVPNPAIVRAQVIVQNYICFVYLGEACFRALVKVSKTGSVTQRCSRFLTDNPVRALRNAVAHANWTYAPEFSGLVFWARKGADPKEALSQFTVTQAELSFWQALSRAVGYAAYTSLNSLEGDPKS